MDRKREEEKKMSYKLAPCPKCGSHDVEWSNCRDLEVQYQFISCESCDLRTFSVATMAFIELPNKDEESAVMKYNAWCATNPGCYCDETWSDRKQNDNMINNMVNVTIRSKPDTNEKSK